MSDETPPIAAPMSVYDEIQASLARVLNEGTRFEPEIVSPAEYQRRLRLESGEPASSVYRLNASDLSVLGDVQ